MKVEWQKADMNKYKLLRVDGGTRASNEVEKISLMKNWKHEVPCKKDNMVGRATRFKNSTSTLRIRP